MLAPSNASLEVINVSAETSDDASALARLERQLPPLLSVIAGMVDLTGFFTLGNVFTAQITGNLVLIAAEAVRGGPAHLAQTLAIPVFIITVAGAWLVARLSGRRREDLARLLLLVQFLLLLALLAFNVITKPSTHPHGLLAGIAAMIAVCAMASQYALLYLAMPHAISTAVMGGNLTKAVLSLMDALSPSHPLMTVDADGLKKSLQLLGGFFVGCAAAAIAICSLGDWAWSVPAVLSGVAVTLPFRASTATDRQHPK